MQIEEQPLSKAVESENTSSLEAHGLYRLGLNFGRQVHRFRWFIIAFWVVIVLVSVPFTAQIGSVLKGGGYSYKNSESARASNIIKEKLPRPATQLLVIFQSTNTGVSNSLYQKEVHGFMNRVRSFPHVTDVFPGGTGLDGRTTYVTVTMAVIYAIGLHISMSVFVLNIASIIGLGISIDYSLFMIRRFRDELAAGRSISDATGWMVATAGESILFSGLIVMIGFCSLLLIGVDIMSSLGIGGAVVVAIAVLTALTLLPALLAVLGHRINALRIPFFSRLTMHTSHTSRAVTDGESSEKPEEERHFWQRWAMGVMKRTVLIILLVTVLLVGMGWPIFSISIGSTSSASVPKSYESRHGIDILNAQFPETNEHPVFIVVQAPDGSSMLTKGNLAKLDHLSRWVVTRAHVTGVISLTQMPASHGTPGTPAISGQQLAILYSSGAYQRNPAMAQLVASTTNGKTTLITVRTKAKVDSREGKDLVNDLRAGDKAAAQGLTVLAGGDQADSLDFNNHLYGNFPLAVLFILITTYMLLLLMFRSVLLPLKAILMNVLSVSACLGLLVFIFQWGNFSNILDFTSEGFLDSVIPILLFCILFGLSMDYEVFLLSRIQEEWLLTHNNRWAVARGLEKTGGVITNAALLFVIVAGAFIFTSLVVTKEMGLGMAMAVLVDATIIRTLLVPATMRLLGRWNWWLPGRQLL